MIDLWIPPPLTYPASSNAPSLCPAGSALKANDCEESRAVTIIPDDEHRAAVIDGLRRLATYLDEHPDVPVGHTPVTLHYSASAGFLDDARAFAEVDRIAALLGATPETSTHGHYTAVKPFGPVVYSVHAMPELEKRRTEAHMSYSDSVTPGGES